MYGVKLKEKSDLVGHECHLLIPKTSKSEKYASENEFLFAKLLARKEVGAIERWGLRSIGLD